MLRILRHNLPTLNFTNYQLKTSWSRVGKLIGVICGQWKQADHPTLSSLFWVTGRRRTQRVGTPARSAEVSLVVSQVSVIPRRSIALTAMRSKRAGALSHIEQVLIVPSRRLHSLGPQFRLTSPVSNRRRDTPTFWCACPILWEVWNDPYCRNITWHLALQGVW